MNASDLDVSRHAARLFLEHGFEATTGAQIARSAGISERTLWRRFGTKEGCTRPLFARSWEQFAVELRAWPAEIALEAHLAQCYQLDRQPQDFLEDGLLIALLVSSLPDQPELRPTWLLSYHDGEAELAELIGRRTSRAADSYDIRLCAAAVMAAIRIVDETLCSAAIRLGKSYTAEDTAAQMARAIRAAATISFCDPLEPQPFGAAFVNQRL